MIPEKHREAVAKCLAESCTPHTIEFLEAQPVTVLSDDFACLVVIPTELLGKRLLSIWVAVGMMESVTKLFNQAEQLAKAQGLAGTVYLGRRGFLRSHGFSEIATLGFKEL